MISIMEKIFLILVVLSSGGLISIDYSIIKIAIIILFLVMLFFKKITIAFNMNLVIFILVVIQLWLGQSVFYRFENSILGGTVRTISLFVIMLLYSYTDNEKNTNRIAYIYRVLFIFTIISDLLFIAILFNIPLPYFNTAISRDTVFYLQTYTGGNILETIWYRNSGIFWEPGLYQVYLNFMLIAVLYMIDMSRFKKIVNIIIIMITILSTGSLMGYFSAGAIWLIFAYMNSELEQVKLFLIILITAIGLILLPKICELFFEKTTTLSYSIRVIDLKEGFSLFLRKPMFGYGLINNAFEHRYFNLYGQARGNSNGLINLLISFGAIGTSVYFWLFYKFADMLKNKCGRRIIPPMVVWFVISLMSEPISIMPIIFLLLGMGLSSTLNCDSSTFNSPEID